MKKKVQITDTTLRDAHQSLWATRMRTEEMLPILEKIDNVGFHSLEVWGFTALTNTGSGNKHSLIQPVEINLGASKTETATVPGQVSQQLKNTLANIYSIRPEAVEIIELKEGKSSVR